MSAPFRAFVRRWRRSLPAHLASELDSFVQDYADDLWDEFESASHQRTRGAEPRTVLSMFDYSGNWAWPFERLGWNVVQVDLKLGDDIATWSAKSLLRDLLESFPSINGILAAPPCTAFAVSGAQHWRAKDADGRTRAAVNLVYQTLRTIDFLQPDFYAIENPIGRIHRLVPELGDPSLTFDPCDYAGWTTSDADREALARIRRDPPRCSREEAELVRATGAYTKRTRLWGSFSTPLRNYVKPIRCSRQGSWLQSLGGASEQTRAERSVTPLGFALAFAAAQHGLSRAALAALADELLRERATAGAHEPAQLGLQSAA